MTTFSMVLAVCLFFGFIFGFGLLAERAALVPVIFQRIGRDTASGALKWTRDGMSAMWGAEGPHYKLSQQNDRGLAVDFRLTADGKSVSVTFDMLSWRKIKGVMVNPESRNDLEAVREFMQ